MMKHFLIYVLLCTFSYTGTSQINPQDSLFSVYQNESLTIETRLKSLSRYTHIYNNIGVDSTITLVEKGYDLALANGNYTYQVIFKRKSAEIHNYQLQDYDKAKALYLQTLELCDKVDGSTSRPGLYKGLADMHMYQNKMEEAKEYYEKSIKYAMELDEPRKSIELGATYVSYGNFYNNNNQFKEAILITKKAQNLFEKLESPNRNIALGNIGSFYNRLGSFDSALFYYKLIPNDPNNSNTIAINNYNIGMIFQNMEYHDSCIYYYTKAYKSFEEFGNKKGQSSSLHGLGIEYSTSGNQMMAIEFFKKAIEICKKTNNIKSMHANYRMIGQSYLKLMEFDNAQTYFTKARGLCTGELLNPTNLAQSFLDFGSLDSKRENWESAILNFDSAIYYYSISEEQDRLAVSINKKAKALIELNNNQEAITLLKTNFPFVLTQTTLSSSNTYKLLSKAYNNLGAIDSAYCYLQKYNTSQDSITKRTNKEMESKMRNEFAVELNQKEKELALAQANKEKMLKYFGFGLFGLTIISLFFIISRHKKYKKEKEASIKLKIDAAEKSIQHSKEILQNQSYLILEKNRIIKELKENIQSYFGEDLTASEHFDNLLEQKILTTEDWENFKKSFGAIYPNFIKKVHFRFPKLTETELRILCLKKLGLTRNEMAEMVGVLPESIKKAVNRFKSKHSIDGSLEDLLQEMK